MNVEEIKKLSDDELVGNFRKKVRCMQGRTDTVLRLNNYFTSKYHVAFNRNNLDDTDKEILKQLLQDEKNGTYGYKQYDFMRMKLGDWLHFKMGRLHHELKGVTFDDIFEWIKLIYFLIASISFPFLIVLIYFGVF